MTEDRWLEAAKRLEAIARTGLHYCDDPYDRERYEEVRAIAQSLLAQRFADAAGRPVVIVEEGGYATPKVEVRAVVRDREGLVLMVRERTDGLWCLPGGWADVGRSPAASAEKEVREESGFEVRAERLLGVFDRRVRAEHAYPYDVYRLAFSCRLLGGRASESIETSEVRWCDPAAPPALSTRRMSRSYFDLLVRLDAEKGPALFD